MLEKGRLINYFNIHKMHMKNVCVNLPFHIHANEEGKKKYKEHGTC
jgi:hypothetical protein